MLVRMGRLGTLAEALRAAMAGRVTIAEVEELVDVGTLDADAVHTPAVFVQRVIQAERGPGYVERRTTRQVV
jgi:3-oxoacid CoA-transferase subunit A